jgi:hypothetical protein
MNFDPAQAFLHYLMHSWKMKKKTDNCYLKTYKEGSTNEDLSLNGIHQFSHNRKEIGLVENTVKTQYCIYSCLTTRMQNKIKDS